MAEPASSASGTPAQARRPSASPRRLVALFVVLMLAFGAMGLRLVMLQTVEAPAYAQLAANQRERVVHFRARRGTIFDRRGEPLAISVDLKTVYADPALVEEPHEAARELSPILDLGVARIEAKLRGTRPGSRFEYLARQVDPKVWEAVRKLGLAGVASRPEPKRFYPNGRLASQVIGFTNVDGEGTAGLESAYDDLLEGTPGRMLLEQDPSGRPLPQAEFSYEPARPGRDIFLTIDKELQYFTELTLARAVETYRAEAATAIVMKPETGEILALANMPDFDLNRFSQAGQQKMRNRAVTDMYEPGSAYKIVTVSAALEEGVVTPRTKLVVPDSLEYADQVFNDSHVHDPEIMSVRKIIEQSSNVGTIKMGLRLGGRLLDRYVRDFGFGAPTGLGFPGEAPGIVLPRRRWSGSTIATVPLGQGIAVTPLQMAAAFSTIANGGVWVEPKLVHGTAGQDGKVVAASPPARRRVVSATTARRVTNMLAGVVARGTGLLARVPGYRVAGKTGTAQKPLPGGGYGNSYIGSFGGYAPVGDPKVAVLVTLDEPSPIWGGSSAAPTFKRIIEYALRELGVPPSGNAAEAAAELEADPAVVPARD
ncbi:MAG: peptidoglycan D,D-transpeptidase FtsI family protein [Actinomycetota bacterium]